MAAVRPPTTAPQPSAGVGEIASRPITDIRSLTAEKQPRSANEMTALVAYYVSEMAPENDRSDTVSADVIRKYFKMAGFPLPTALRSVLPNAAAAGYMESVGQGEYRLNPVGYNLVVHRRDSKPADALSLLDQLGERQEPANVAQRLLAEREGRPQDLLFHLVPPIIWGDQVEPDAGVGPIGGAVSLDRVPALLGVRRRHDPHAEEQPGGPVLLHRTLAPGLVVLLEQRGHPHEGSRRGGAPGHQ